jgi:hypothetical protein
LNISKSKEWIQVSRIASPNLDFPEQIASTGIALINCLADDIYRYIETYLESLGSKSLYLTSEGLFMGDDSLNMRDPSSLFKVLSRSDYPVLRDQFRSGLNLMVDQKNRFEFYNKISEILDDRHDWVHKNISPTEASLRELIASISFICTTLNLPLSTDCEILTNFLNGKVPVLKDASNEQETIQIVQEIQKVLISEEPAIGSIIQNDFLEYSYTLHTSGQIRDRKTDKLLTHEIGPASDSVSALLVARKPSGGRLKITSSGEICAYFDGSWGYLARIDSDHWFPGHLS